MEFWMVGQNKNPENSLEWELTGMFASKQLAVQACTVEERFVTGPHVLNEVLPLESVRAPIGWYPLLESKEEGIARLGEEQGHIPVR